MGLATAHQIQYHLWFSLSACDWSVVTAAPPAPPAKSSLFSKAHAHLKGSQAGIWGDGCVSICLVHLRFLTRFMRPWQDARKRSVRGVYAIVWPNVYASSWVLCVWCFLQIALAKATFPTSKCPGCPTPAAQNGWHSSKNEHSALAKLRCTLCVSLRSRNAHRHLTMTLLCENLQQKYRGQRAYPDLTPALLTTVRTPQCGHTVWGTTRIINLRVDIYSILYSCRWPSSIASLYSTRGYTGSWVSPLRKGWSSIGSLQCPPGCCQR